MINLFGLFEGVYCFVVRGIVNVFFFGQCFFFNCMFYLMVLYINKILYLIKYGIKFGGVIKVLGCLCEGVWGLLGFLFYYYQVDIL